MLQSIKHLYPAKGEDFLIAHVRFRKRKLCDLLFFWSTWPTHSHGRYSDHYFRTCCPFLLPSPFFTKQNKFQAKTMFTCGETVGMAEWIIDDTYFSFFPSTTKVPCRLFVSDIERIKTDFFSTFTCNISWSFVHCLVFLP